MEGIISGGQIIFITGDNYEILTTHINKTIVLVGNGSTIKRNGKYVFVLENESVVTISNLTLNTGIDVKNGAELNLNEITFTASDVVGGIVYEVGSVGSIVNSCFIGTTGLDDDHIVSVNGAVDIVNSEFKDNSISGSAVYYGEYASGNVSGSVFTGNTATSLRNLEIDSNTVVLSGNTYDVIVDDVAITNDIYGNGANVTGKFDVGVNFFNNEVTLTINDTLNTQATVTPNNDGDFTFKLTNALNVGKYNLTATVADGNTYIISYNDNQFEIIKSDTSIVNIADLEVVYGVNLFMV